MTAPLRLPDGRIPLLLSAHAADLIADDARRLLRYLDREPEVAAIAATLLRTRRIRRFRTVIRAADTAELAQGLRAVITGTDHRLVSRSDSAAAPKPAFVFPGQGSQWPGMGAEAYRQLPEYRAEADRCAAAFTARDLASPLRYLTGDADSDDFAQIDIQGAQFVHAAALARLWLAHGVTPSCTIGHSLGEVAAAYVAGAIALPDAVAAVGARAATVQQLHGRYGMAVLGVSAAGAETLMADTPGWLELSAVNSATSVVVSGDREAISHIVAVVAARGEFARELTVDYPGHTSALEGPGQLMRQQLPDIAFAEAPIPFIGSCSGAVVPAGTAFAEYWYRNLRTTVRFDRAVRCAIASGSGAFVELSAHPALQLALAEATDGPVLGSGRRDADVVEELSAGIVAAASTDPDYRWSDYLDVGEPTLRNFPPAPMQAVPLWIAAEPPAPVAALTTAVETWQPLAVQRLAVPATLRGVAVLELGGQTGLSNTLRRAFDRHPGVSAVAPQDAETLVVIAPPLDHPDAVRAAEEITDLVASGLLRYVDAIGSRCRDVVLLTVGGEQVDADEPVALPAQAALAAMHRTIGFDHVDQAFRHVDLPGWELDDESAATVTDVLLTEVAEAAARTGRGGPLLYRRALADATPAQPWALDTGVLDNVLITGGAGAIGLHYAHHLAQRGARRIVLLSRRGAEQSVLDDLSQRYGTEVVSPRCDITNAAMLSATADRFAEGGASLVIHAAAVATLGTGAGFTAADFADTFGAKVIGLARMAEHWPLRADARMVLCSSVSGVWGGRGHPAYPAANRMLDVMAGQLRSEGHACVAVRWGLWQVDGIADAAEMIQIARSGLRPMPAHLAIAAGLADHHLDPMVFAADPERLRVFFDTQHASHHDDDQGPGGGEVDALGAVRAELAAVLRVPDTAQIDLGSSLFELGIDSLLALDLRKRLKRVTGRSVPLAKLLGGITAVGLIAEIDGTAGHNESTQKVESSRD